MSKDLDCSTLGSDKSLLIEYMLMEKIDNLDRKILEIIMRNARIASKDVATECGVSRAAIHQRIQRMIDLNVYNRLGLQCRSESAWLPHLYIYRCQS